MTPAASSVADLVGLRVRHPEAVAEAAARRRRRPLIGDSGRLMIIAADHPARGSFAVGGRELAMANRFELLERLCLALSRPGVDGVLGTADILDDLLLLGALEDKVVIGSMNRGGLAGASFELDDRFTGLRRCPPYCWAARWAATRRVCTRNGVARCDFPPFRGWWWGDRCSIRSAGMWPVPSTRPWHCCSEWTGTGREKA
jgi:Cgl0159-like